MTGRTDGLDFDDYVAGHGRVLERYAFVLTGQPATAQDLVQTALLKAYRRWRRIARLEHPDAYVRRIVTNCFLDERRLGRRREQSLDTLTDSPASDAYDPADRVAGRDEIARALMRVTPHQRAVIVLRHYIGLDDAAIARELGCSETTVRSHASRGLQRMRDVLGEPDGPGTMPSIADPGPTAAKAIRDPRRRSR